MKLVTSSQMQQLDRAAIERGIPSLSLMERAGTAVADAVHKLAEGRRGMVVIACGRGNNGGDGLVAARLLIERGMDVAIFLFARPSDLSADAKANWERLAPLTTHLYEITSFEELTPHHPIIAGASVIVDALFGTGLTREISGPMKRIIEYLNAVKRPVVAVDMPSGLSADTGRPLGVAIRATTTVTFGLPKQGLYVGDGDRYAGTIEVADIGIPADEIEKLATSHAVADHDMVLACFAPREPRSHKGTYGHVGIIAGSGGKLGAGYLASLAALRAGAGLVTYFLPEKAFEKFDARYPEIMCEPIPDKGRGHFHPDGVRMLVEKLAKIDVVAIGPAVATHEDTRAFQQSLVGSLTKPLVVDADGLNNLDLNQVKRRPAATVLTPHPGEFSQLTGMSTDKVQQDRCAMAEAFAKEYRSILVLKGHHTIIAMPDGQVVINPTGNPAMASAGMGDALTGVIAGLMAQKVKPSLAAVAGTYIHGLAGDRAAEEIGDRGIVASDVIKRLPAVMRAIPAEVRS